MNICSDCLKTDCQFRNNKATICANHSVEVFSYRAYIENENDPEKLMSSFINGWPAVLDGKSRAVIKQKCISVPESSYVKSEDFKQCSPQTAYELLKRKIGAKERV